MRFSGREDIDAPPGQVFERLADFAAHERAAMRRGVRVQRLDRLAGPGPGMVWEAEARFRGRPRLVTIELSEIVRPERICYGLESAGLAGLFTLDLVALSARRTRLQVVLELRPRNLSGRLLVQSLRLVKPGLNRRFRTRLADYARGLSRG